MCIQWPKSMLNHTMVSCDLGKVCPCLTTNSGQHLIWFLLCCGQSHVTSSNPAQSWSMWQRLGQFPLQRRATPLWYQHNTLISKMCSWISISRGEENPTYPTQRHVLGNTPSKLSEGHVSIVDVHRPARLTNHKLVQVDSISRDLEKSRFGPSRRGRMDEAIATRVLCCSLWTRFELVNRRHRTTHLRL